LEKSRRVIGGVETSAGVYPWIAALSYNGQLGRCSATLISSNWAITAAHCVSPNFPPNDPTSLVLGEHDLSNANDILDSSLNRKEVSVTTIHNTNYDSSTVNNDIALLKLAEAVDLSIYTPACLPASSADYVGQTAKVYGWGKTDLCSSTTSSKLMEAEVTVVSDADCDAGSGQPFLQCSGDPTTVSYSGKITDQMLCASATGKDSCQGDSGGPLTVKASDQHYLAGIVSWGYGCAADGLPGVYTEVAKLRSWVDGAIALHGGIGATCDA
jgi:secreted trypsin-like serine protease